VFSYYCIFFIKKKVKRRKECFVYISRRVKKRGEYVIVYLFNEIINNGEFPIEQYHN